MVNATLIYGIELNRKEFYTAICSLASSLPENDKIIKALNMQSFTKFEDFVNDEEFEAYDFIDDVNKELFGSEQGLKFNFRLNSACCCCNNKNKKPYFFGWSSAGCAANGIFSKKIKMISQKDKVELKNMIKRINEKGRANFFVAAQDCDYCS